MNTTTAKPMIIATGPLVMPLRYDANPPSRRKSPMEPTIGQWLGFGR